MEKTQRLDLNVYFASVADAVIATDKSFRIMYWNRGAESIYGWREDEVLGKPIGDYTAGIWESAADYRLVVQDLWARGSWHGQVSQHRRDGSTVRVQSVVSVVRDAEGVVSGVVAVNQDITAQYEADHALDVARDRLLNQQKQDALDRLCHTVAVDLADSIALLDTAVSSNSLEQAELALARLRACQQSLTFRPPADAAHEKVVDLVARLPEGARRLQDAVGPTIAIDLDLPDGPIRTRADLDVLTEVLLQLVTNARDALPEGGVVLIRLTHQDGRAHISVVDDCVGMDDDTLTHAFEPFFSTKPRSVARGLGLTRAFSMMRSMSSTIEITSHPGRGTTVDLTLPMAPQPVG